MYKLLYVAVLCCMAVLAQASDIYSSLLSGKSMRNASVAVHIVDVDSRQVVASYNADRALVPASLTKVLTAASVLRCYPDTTRWYTTVGYDGVLSDSILQGNIIVKGAIDPSLAHDAMQQSSAQFLAPILDAIGRAGIKRIEGNIIADASVCDIDINGSWMLEDFGFYYGAGCFGINYRGNEYDLSLRTDTLGRRPAILGTSVPLYPVSYRNHLVVGRNDSASVIATPYSAETLLLGSVPQQNEPFKLRCAITDPPRQLALDLYNALQQVGIAVAGQPLTHLQYVEEGRSIPQWHTHLYTHASCRLTDMLRYMMHKSHNLYAEAMLRYVSLSQSNVASTRQGLSTVRDIWQEQGFPVDEMNLFDGSGMSKKNTLTARFIASLLVSAYHDSELGQDFVGLFPLAGREGSVRSFMAQKPLPGELRLKSGSMQGVLCYAGYYTRQGKTYALVLMSNNHTCKAGEVRKKFENLLRDMWSPKN